MQIQEIVAKNNKRWIHFDSVTEELGEYLKENFKFHPLDIEDVMSDRQRPKLDTYKNYLFLIAVFPYFDKEEKQRIRGREVDFFITKNVLITICKKSNPGLDDFFKRVSESEKLQRIWLERDPSFILYKILELQFRHTGVALDELGRQIHDVEEDVYGHELKSVASDLAVLRRCILALRRMLDPQRVTINGLVLMKKDFMTEEMSIYFDNIHDYVEKVWVETDNCKDTVEGLHLTNESLVSQHTNQIIKILTVISVGMMPLTLLSGIYGMNLIHLPFADQPIVVFGLFVFVATVIFGGVALFYRKGRF